MSPFRIAIYGGGGAVDCLTHLVASSVVHAMIFNAVFRVLHGMSLMQALVLVGIVLVELERVCRYHRRKLTRIKTCLGMLGSGLDGEVGNAARMISKVVRRLGLTTVDLPTLLGGDSGGGTASKEGDACLYRARWLDAVKLADQEPRSVITSKERTSRNGVEIPNRHL